MQTLHNLDEYRIHCYTNVYQRLEGAIFFAPIQKNS